MTPASMIESIHIRGFRSLADVQLSNIPQAAVLIGANGSGKSNFLRFMDMLSNVAMCHLGEFVEQEGGTEEQLFGGNEVTPLLEAQITLRNGSSRIGYCLGLACVYPGMFSFEHEAFRYSGGGSLADEPWRFLGTGHREAQIARVTQSRTFVGGDVSAAEGIVDLLGNCVIYKFHDTSDSSNFKKKWEVTESHRLRSDGGNLAAVLYRLEREDTQRYDYICYQIGRILPGFDGFAIEENYGKVQLRWKDKWTGKTFSAHVTSGGSLRFFALATLLSLPSEMLPSVILLDEPELGLHPTSIALVGGLIKSMSVERQVIVATQATLLVDSFDLEEIIIADLKNGRTQFRKLNPHKYKHWLEDGYSAGDLWRMNLFGGRP